MAPRGDNVTPESTLVKNHLTGHRLKVELVDFPFPARSFRLRVNGQFAEKIPTGSKSSVLAEIRKWWVAH